MQNVIFKSFSDIKPYDNNPRFNQDAIDFVAKSIKEFGFLNPIIITQNDLIINGHTRYLAAQRLGLKEIPCIVVDNLTEAEIRAYRLADNKVSEYSTWDYANLVVEVKDLLKESFNTDMLGFANDVLEDLLYYGVEDTIWDGETDPDRLPEMIDEDTDSCSGERYSFGDHVLQVGGDLNLLMSGISANLYLTKTEDAEKISSALSHLDGAFYILSSDEKMLNISDAVRLQDFEIQQKLLWIGTKKAESQKYLIKNETIYYGWKSNMPHRWFNDRKQNNLLNHENAISGHPPSSLWVYLIRNSTLRDDIVLDNAAEDGGVLIACERTGRKCIVQTGDCRQADLIRKRWAEFVYGEGCNWKELTGERK